MGHTLEMMLVTYSRLDWNSARVLRKRGNGHQFHYSARVTAPSAPRFLKNRRSNWFCNFSRIKSVAKDRTVA